MAINQASQSGANESSASESTSAPDSAPVRGVYAVFRIALPTGDDTDAVERDIREAVVIAVRDVLERKAAVHDCVSLEYRYDITTDWLPLV